MAHKERSDAVPRSGNGTTGEWHNGATAQRRNDTTGEMVNLFCIMKYTYKR